MTGRPFFLLDPIATNPVTTLRTLTFPGPAGRLEAIYHRPANPAPAAAVVCHPLPTHGGTMHTKAVHRAAKALSAVGCAVLRFNFRGVGRSDGAFDGGRGEAADVRAALDWLASGHPKIPAVVAGFSFGCAVALPVGAADPRVERLVGIGTPTDRFDFAALEGLVKPALFVQGDRDVFGPPADLEASLAGLGAAARLVVVPGADHFFTDRLDELERAIVDWWADLAEPDPHLATP